MMSFLLRPEERADPVPGSPAASDPVCSRLEGSGVIPESSVSDARQRRELSGIDPKWSGTVETGWTPVRSG